ncbi:DUF4124 domain-containing protein [Teredinibacter haidensis]|uniref:DUF4124 domain-containing protein n=1 Tax=Teredinibacter haidensis TaxID=2731755 RepID=UPI000948AFEF|nr:DUF4124 domain-containing protein [Teredinibacter haidensis]
MKSFLHSRVTTLKASSLRYARLLALVAITVLAPPLFAEGDEVKQASKWVDEDGRVHYGDTIPEKYRNKAEAINLEEAPKQGLSDKEIAAQKRKTATYQRHLDLTRKSEAHRKSHPPEAKPQNNGAKRESVLTREQCRDRHPHKTADRVRCFKKAESQTNP